MLINYDARITHAPIPVSHIQEEKDNKHKWLPSETLGLNYDIVLIRFYIV